MKVAYQEEVNHLSAQNDRKPSSFHARNTQKSSTETAPSGQVNGWDANSGHGNG